MKKAQLGGFCFAGARNGTRVKQAPRETVELAAPYALCVGERIVTNKLERSLTRTSWSVMRGLMNVIIAPLLLACHLFALRRATIPSRAKPQLTAGRARRRNHGQNRGVIFIVHKLVERARGMRAFPRGRARTPRSEYNADAMGGSSTAVAVTRISTAGSVCVLRKHVFAAGCIQQNIALGVSRRVGRVADNAAKTPLPSVSFIGAATWPSRFA